MLGSKSVSASTWHRGDSRSAASRRPGQSKNRTPANRRDHRTLITISQFLLGTLQRDRGDSPEWRCWIDQAHLISCDGDCSPLIGSIPVGISGADVMDQSFMILLVNLIGAIVRDGPLYNRFVLGVRACVLVVRGKLGKIRRQDYYRNMPAYVSEQIGQQQPDCDC